MLTNHTSRFVCSHPHLHSRNGGKASRHRRKSNLVLSLVTHGVLFQFPHAHTHTHTHTLVGTVKRLGRILWRWPVTRARLRWLCRGYATGVWQLRHDGHAGRPCGSQPAQCARAQCRRRQRRQRPGRSWRSRRCHTNGRCSWRSVTQRCHAQRGAAATAFLHCHAPLHHHQPHLHDPCPGQPSLRTHRTSRKVPSLSIGTTRARICHLVVLLVCVCRARPVGTPLSDVTGRAGSTRSFGGALMPQAAATVPSVFSALPNPTIITPPFLTQSDKRSVASGGQFRSRTPIMGSAADGMAQ